METSTERVNVIKGSNSVFSQKKFREAGIETMLPEASAEGISQNKKINKEGYWRREHITKPILAVLAVD
jgi:hypothetical protein